MRFKCLACLLLFAVVLVNAQNFVPDKYKDKEQEFTRLRAASAAVLPEKWQKEINWQRIESMVRRAAVEGGARLVVTPEGVLEGYVINEVNSDMEASIHEERTQRFIEVAEPIDGPYIAKACELADELDIFLVLGFLEKRVGNRLYNTSIMIDDEGDIIGRYSKTHFAQGYDINPDEYCASDEYPVIYTPFGIVGIVICYDRQLPEPARIMAVQGAQALIVPAYGSYSDEDGWNTVLMRTRAYENRFPVIYCNPYQSLLISNGGEIKSMGGANEIVYFELKMEPNRIKNRFKNRRPQTYKALTQPEN